jgi:DNA-binding response OmpR family regulator
VRKKLKAGGLTEEIIETIYGMGYRLKPYQKKAESTETENTNKLAAINKVIEQFRGHLRNQIAVLLEARIAFLAGNFSKEIYQTAQQEAHKLAGSLGSFGYPEGSKLARTIEHLLSNNSTLTPEQISRFSQLVTALQQELAKSPIPLSAASDSPEKKYQVLAIAQDVIFMEKLQGEAESWGIEMSIVEDLATVRSQITLTPPDLVLLDLSFPDKEEEGLMLLRELAENLPDLPIVVITVRDSLSDRLTVSRLGARQFLHKPTTTEQIFRAISRVLPHSPTTEAKVLIVDDDPLILTNLKALLTPWGLEVVTLNEPQRFWEVLIATSPNLVVLDLEMPLVSGLDLCQVIRQDAQWGDVPILVVTAHTDGESLQQAFAAGADDFITKPVLGPELVTRILSRIERNRFLLKNREK